VQRPDIGFHIKLLAGGGGYLLEVVAAVTPTQPRKSRQSQALCISTCLPIQPQIKIGATQSVSSRKMTKTNSYPLLLFQPQIIDHLTTATTPPVALGLSRSRHQARSQPPSRRTPARLMRKPFPDRITVQVTPDG
jgi:hypothetical protein